MRGLLLIAVLVMAPGAARPADPIFDLRGQGLEGWEGSKEIFEIRDGASLLDPTRRFKILLSKKENKLQWTGRIKSPAFQITRPVLGFFLGGRETNKEAFVGLEVDGQLVLTAAGWNNGGITCVPNYFKVHRWIGKEARIVLADLNDRHGWVEAGDFRFYPSAEEFLHQTWGTRADDLMIADWADGTYQGWNTTGETFRRKPMNLSLNRYAGWDVRGGIGCRFVASSHDQGRSVPEERQGIRIRQTGTLTSPEFQITRPYVNLQMAGGRDRDNLYVELLIDGRQVRKAGGYEHQQVEWATFDVRELQHQKARLRLVDKVHGGPWDHVLVGLIVQGHEQYGEIEPDSQQRGVTFQETFRPRFHYTAKSGWINDPNGFVYAGGWYHIMSQASDFGEGMNMSWGHARSRNLFDLEYLDRSAAPVSNYRGNENKNRFVPDRSPNTAIFPGGCWSGSAIVDLSNITGLKQGPYDPILCFITSFDSHWTAEEHPQFAAHQYVAYSTDDGISWKPVATDQHGTALPTVVNIGYQLLQMTGKGKDEFICPPEAGELQARSFPVDKTPGIKPIDFQSNRDPKVIWYEPGKKFVMVLFTGRGPYFALLESKDLLKWDWMVTMRLPEGMHECPDLFSLPVLNEPDTQKWVFMANNTYIVGDFDGRRFTPDPYYRKHLFPVNAGRNGGPLQLVNQAPQGRRICMAWMGGGRFPRNPFTQQFSLPTQCTLHRHADGMVRLYLYPVREFDALRLDRIIEMKDVDVADGQEIDLTDRWSDLMDIEAEFEVGDAREVGFQVKDEQILWTQGHIRSGGSQRPLKPIDGVVTMRIVIDMNSFELFANQGEVALSANFMGNWWDHLRTIKRPFPRRVLRDHSFKVFAKGGDAKLKNLLVWRVREIKRKDLSITSSR